MIRKTSNISRRAITYDEVAKYAEERGLVYLETSAMNQINVDEAFNLVARKILNLIDENVVDPYNEVY